MSNKPIYIKYKNSKGKRVERLVTDLVTSFEKFKDIEMWVLRCTCCELNLPLVIPLKGITFIE